MPTLDEVRKEMERFKPSAIADGAGLHLNTVYNVLNKGGNPSYDTIRKIVVWMRKRGV